MKNFGIGGKFTVVVLVFVVTIFAVFGIGLFNLVHVKNVSSNLIEVVAARRYTSTVVYTVIEAASSFEKDLILNKDLVLGKKLEEGFQTNLSHANEFMAKLKPLIGPANQKDYDSAVVNFQKWKDATIKVNALAIENKDDDAYALMVSSLNPAKEAFAKDVLSIATAASAEFDKALAGNNATFEEARDFGILVSLIGLIIGCGLSFVIIRSMKNSINQMVDVLNDTSLQVASASGQVATSSQSLAETATEQASSLEETSSAVEEMNSMIARNAQAARESSELSQRGMASATRGQQVVQSMIASMGEINLANKEVVRQTDESNQRIAEIVQVINEIGNKTKVINEIVFQTKLLSFNASVEAARAGEHGKGFAVVAEEVGNLAQMSGSAAKDITALLDGSVQKVQAIVSDSKAKIEKIIGENNKKVESGTRIAGECRDVLNEIVEGMSTVSQMVQSISGASDEQSRGIDEINRAIIQLDQVTQSNAATSEEAASASEELSAQAGHMKVAVNGLMRIVRGANAAPMDASTQREPQIRSAKPPSSPSRKAVSKSPAPRAGQGPKSGSKNSNVIRMGRPEKAHSAPEASIRLAMGSDMIPSEDDPRFKDL